MFTCSTWFRLNYVKVKQNIINNNWNSGSDCNGCNILASEKRGGYKKNN